MPIIKVYATEGLTTAEKHLVAKMTNTVVDTLKRPSEKVRVIINEYKFTNFAVNGETIKKRIEKEGAENEDTNNSDVMIEAIIMEGRTPDDKESFIAHMTETVASAGFRKSNIRMLITELKPKNFAVNGKLAK